MLRARANSSDADSKLQKILLAVSDGAFDMPVEKAAWICHRQLVLLTPKRWTGLTRRSWKVEKPAVGQRIIFNTSKVMLFLERGTGNAGTPTSNGGYIYPKTKRFLFIPLKASAMFGWKPSMKFGRDYVLARRVRGIAARRIIENYRPKALEVLKDQMRQFLQKAIQ